MHESVGELFTTSLAENDFSCLRYGDDRGGVSVLEKPPFAKRRPLQAVDWDTVSTISAQKLFFDGSRTVAFFMASFLQKPVSAKRRSMSGAVSAAFFAQLARNDFLRGP